MFSTWAGAATALITFVALIGPALILGHRLSICFGIIMTVGTLIGAALMGIFVRTAVITVGSYSFCWVFRWMNKKYPKA